MRPIRLAAIFLIYLGVSLAWLVLGASVSVRTQTGFERLRPQGAGLWGGPLEQRAPVLTIAETIAHRDTKGKPFTETVDHVLVPDRSRIHVELDSDARRKGLLW